MSRWSQASTVRIAGSSSFVYTPPEQAYGAARILVKPNLAYRAPHPATVSIPVLATVLRGLRRASPLGRILIMEGITGKGDAVERMEAHGLADVIDNEMRLGDAEDVLMATYANTAASPVKYDQMTAPEAIGSFDCVISVAPWKRTRLDNGQLLYSGSTKNLYGLLPRSEYHARSPYSRGQLHRPSVDAVLTDVYFSIGHLFHGAVVDMTQVYRSNDWRPDRVRGIASSLGSVVWGNDMIEVDRTAARLAGDETPAYIETIERARQDAKTASAG